ncbi:neuropeptides capa receptor [Galendromus occidentalis]|uniref:Neuropeptides capa receptor n=1 Tax=Galendromus occidentalis TaxID=34638 RepID=A0AAJ7L5L1_9ACAR|nr:neuropeptides capa receptor [Galendromus occidentalis]
MHTATNYYLFSLAVADMLTLVLGLPNDLVTYWKQYPYAFSSSFCSMRALVSEMTVNASVLTIVAFTVERYLAICHPLYKHKMSNQLARVLKIISSIWLIALLSALPLAARSSVLYQFVKGVRLDDSAFCLLHGSNDVNTALLLGSTVIFFILPMIFIVILYLRIGFKLRRSTLYKGQSGSNSTSFKNVNGANGGSSKSVCGAPVRKFSLINGTRQQQHHLSSSRKIIKLLVSVVIIFFICYAPHHTQRLMYAYGSHMGWSNELRSFNEQLFYIGGCLFYANCTTNPILYNVISKKYRSAFRHTLCRCCGLKGAPTYPRGDHRMSYSSVWLSNQQRVLERKRLSEGSLLSRASVQSDIPIPLHHSQSLTGPTHLKLLRPSHSEPNGTAVTFRDAPPPMKGCIREPTIWCVEEVSCDERLQENN